ncbi:hypothetical protein [Plantibacter sp. YIM 135249]|uniref:hypothetical protein n=1 Tax=Plantibacter sp. YIM 135249 TaxID=3423918 RepID=UPI003D3403C9
MTDQGPEPAEAPIVRSKRSRRVQRPGAPGTDPEPQLPSAPVKASEDTDLAWGGAKPSTGGNDDELKRNVPPHW